jgi:hypothetical protein
MKIRRAILTVAAATFLSLAPLSRAETPATKPAVVDFGDSTAATLTKKAWAALEAKKYDQLKTLVDKCLELHGPKAAEMQKSLKDFADTGKEHDFWALNDCGTCQFILAKSLDAQGQKKEAIAAYKLVSEKFGYAQCWDPQGWFWKPAEASKDRIKELEADPAK